MVTGNTNREEGNGNVILTTRKAMVTCNTNHKKSNGNTWY